MQSVFHLTEYQIIVMLYALKRERVKRGERLFCSAILIDPKGGCQYSIGVYTVKTV